MRARGIIIAACPVLIVACGPNHVGWGDARPIHKAAYRGNISALEREIAAGAELNRKTRVPRWAFYEPSDWHMTPLELAARAGECEAMELLVKSGASVPESLLHKIVDRCPECLPGLLALGVPPDVIVPAALHGGTALHVAASYGGTDSAAALLAAGADVNARTYHHNETPLHTAARFGNVAVVRVLLQHGADPRAKDARGLTPFESVGTYSQSREELRDLLRTAGQGPVPGPAGP